MNGSFPSAAQPQQESHIPPPMPEPPQTRSLFKWILVVTAVAILSSAATYFVVQSQSTKQTPKQVTQTAPFPTPTPDETANWKTYTGLGYEIRYPNYLNLMEMKYGPLNPPKEYDFIFLSDMKMDLSGWPDSSNILATMPYISQAEGGLIIWKGFRLKVWPVPQATFDFVDKGKLKKVTINSLEGFKEDVNLNQIGDYKSTNITVYIIKNDGKVYSIEGTYNSSNNSIHGKYSALFDQILSTFRFD